MITPGTAGRHIENIKPKIDARNRAQASLFAAKPGLLCAQPTTAS